MGVATYRTSSELPKEYEGILPEPEELRKLMWLITIVCEKTREVQKKMTFLYFSTSEEIQKNTLT